MISDSRYRRRRCRDRRRFSLDSLDSDKFRRITRTGDLDKVLAGVEAAKAAGFDRIKLNAVILKGRNEDEILDLAYYAVDQGIDISYIEEMPLGLMPEEQRRKIRNRYVTIISNIKVDGKPIGGFTELTELHMDGELDELMQSD